MPSLFIVVALLLLQPASCKPDAAAEKAVRMKTSRQLKEILTELKIKFDKDDDKEDLRAIALKHDAVSKWEALHPEKKKQPRPAGGGPGNIGTQDHGSMADSMFQMLDKNLDGKLSSEEMASMGMEGGAQADEAFKQIDTDGDGFASRAEVAAFFKMLSTMGGMGGMGGGGDGGMGADSSSKPAPKQSQQPKPKPTKPAQQTTPTPASTDEDDDELPSHDEL